MSDLFPIFWLTGNSGAGKTTLAQGIQRHFQDAVPSDHPLYRRILVLDGDEMRDTISTHESLSPEDRRSHNLRVARLANLLRSQGFLVVVAVIAPFQALRAEIDTLCSPLWVYLKRSHLEAPDRPYEPPSVFAHAIDTDLLSIEESRSSFLCFMENVLRGSKDSC